MRPAFRFFLAASVFVLVLTTPAIAQDSTGKSENSTAKKIKEGTRIIISTSGPVEFNSYWLGSPPRIVVEFQAGNILSEIGGEITVDQGVIKRITAEYFGSGEKEALKSLSFELTQKAPYKIWQEIDTVILDIQTPQEISVLLEDDLEIFTKNEPKEEMFKRPGVMDTAFTKVSTNHLPSGAAPEVITEFPKTRRKTMSAAFSAAITPPTAGWLIGLTLISGVGLLAWLFWRRYKLIPDQNAAVQEIEKLKFQVAEKNNLLEQEEIIRKTIENTSLTKEKDFEHLKLELQKGKKLLEEEVQTRMTLEESLSQKEKESEQVKNSFEFLKEALVNKGLAKKISSSEGEEELWIPGKSSEKRQFPRLDLSRDYNRTIILRIESPDKFKSIKSFANNISLGGLCFETRGDFEEKETPNLRLFFFGKKVPILKVKAEIIWKKTDSPVNHYGVSFVLLEDKDKAELSRYIEVKIARE